jgi:hypothetical protein
MQGLKVKRTKGLCPTNVKMFYTNLVKAYNLHKYQPNKIWNYDKSSVQVGWNGGALVLVKIGSRSMHYITLVEHEWLSILSYINTNKQIFAKFLHIQNQQLCQNYIEHYEYRATMAM